MKNILEILSEIEIDLSNNTHQVIKKCNQIRLEYQLTNYELSKVHEIISKAYLLNGNEVSSLLHISSSIELSEEISNVHLKTELLSSLGYTEQFKSFCIKHLDLFVSSKRLPTGILSLPDLRDGNQLVNILVDHYNRSVISIDPVFRFYNIVTSGYSSIRFKIGRELLKKLDYNLFVAYYNSSDKGGDPIGYEVDFNLNWKYRKKVHFKMDAACFFPKIGLGQHIQCNDVHMPIIINICGIISH